MKLKSILLALSSLVLFAAPAAFAETTAAPRIVNAAATADPSKAQRLVLAKQLVELDGTVTASNMATEQIMPLMTMALNGQEEFRALPKADQNKINELIGAEFKSYFIGKLIEATADYYATNMTEDELKGTIAGLSHPHMKAYIRVRTQSTSDMAKIGEQLGQDTATRALTKYAEWKGKQ